jgi:hypothetical protein
MHGAVQDGFNAGGFMLNWNQGNIVSGKECRPWQKEIVQAKKEAGLKPNLL